MNHQYFLIVLFSLLLGACSNDNRDLVRYIQQVKQHKLNEIPPYPTFDKVSPFKLANDATRRNPFKPTSLKNPVLYPRNKLLAAYPLSALKFVGTLIQGTRRWGLIAEPNTQIIRVRVGDYVGEHYGRVVAINQDEMSLEETIKGHSGTWEKHRSTLKLHLEKQE